MCSFIQKSNQPYSGISICSSHQCAGIESLFNQSYLLSVTSPMKEDTCEGFVPVHTVALTQKQQFVYNLDMAFDSAFIIREDFMHICSMHCYSSRNKEAFWTELKIRDIWHSFSHKSFWELGAEDCGLSSRLLPVLGFLCPIKALSSKHEQQPPWPIQPSDKASSGLKRISLQSCRFEHQQQCQETPKALITGTQWKRKGLKT